jgi:hypothetical protein
MRAPADTLLITSENFMKPVWFSALTTALAVTAGSVRAEDAADPMDHSRMGHGMTGMYGDYPMIREASGTSWQPD